MILLIGKKQPKIIKKTNAGRSAGSKRKRDAAGLQAELYRLDKEILTLTGLEQALAYELGARFAELRGQRMRAGKDTKRAEMIDLSLKTDSCIDRIYFLESRRKDILKRM